MNRVSRMLPLLVVVGSGAWLGLNARMPDDKSGEMKIRAFGRLPVVYEGRVKPLDTLARNSLLFISDRQTFKDASDDTQPAIRWLLDVISDAPAAVEHKVFRIEHPQVLELLGLESRKGFRYAWKEIDSKYESGFVPQAHQAYGHEPSSRDVYDNKVLELYNKVQRYHELRSALLAPHIETEQALLAAVRAYSEMSKPSMPRVIPPSKQRPDWMPLIETALVNSALALGVAENLGLESIEPNADAQALVEMLRSYRAGEVAAFNSALATYQDRLAKTPPEGTHKLGSEAFFNHVELFYRASVFYVFAFLLSVFSWLGWSRPLSRTAFWLIAFTLVLHTTGLIARVYISGYPPVTSLYSSAIFIGWGCVILGLVLEMIRPIGVGNLIGSVTGFLTLLIAHFLSGDGDTFKMMQAVLDTRFWLATHVTTITLGYTATYVAGSIAVLFILRGVFTRSLDSEMQRELGRMIYGVLCFALLLSFVGTVLGGLWADDSWGRFWGWDPKENGALIIVLWNALVLHARWGGMIKARGMAVLAIFGNIVTSWSWFGVNQLGIGLHSYGFMESAAFWLIVFVASQLLIMAIGLLPRRMWRSYDILTTGSTGNGNSGNGNGQPMWSRT